MDKTSHINPIKIRRNFGDTLIDIGGMFDVATIAEKFGEMFIGGTHDAIYEANVANIKEMWHI